MGLFCRILSRNTSSLVECIGGVHGESPRGNLWMCWSFVRPILCNAWKETLMVVFTYTHIYYILKIKIYHCISTITRLPSCLRGVTQKLTPHGSADLPFTKEPWHLAARSCHDALRYSCGLATSLPVQELTEAEASKHTQFMSNRRNRQKTCSSSKEQNKMMRSFMQDASTQTRSNISSKLNVVK